MSDDIKGTIKQLKATVNMPKSLFSGLILIAVAIGFFSFSSIKNTQQEQQYIENPQVGDVFVLKDPEESTEYDHFLMKINEVTGDSLWVSFSAYSYNGVVSELDPRDGFYNYEYSIPKSALDKYQESGELRKVMRDYTSDAGFDRVIEYEVPDPLEVE